MFKNAKSLKKICFFLHSINLQSIFAIIVPLLFDNKLFRHLLLCPWTFVASIEFAYVSRILQALGKDKIISHSNIIINFKIFIKKKD